MSVVAFVVVLCALIGAALMIRRSSHALGVVLGLVAVLAVSLVLMAAGVEAAGWTALVLTPLVVFTMFPFGGLGDN